MGCYTYRKDLYYVQLMIKPGTFRDVTVNRLIWYSYKLLFWRYKKMKNFNVLTRKKRSYYD